MFIRNFACSSLLRVLQERKKEFSTFLLFFFASLHRAVMKMLFMSWHSHAQHLLKEQGGRKNARRQTQLGTSSPFFEDVQVGSLKVHSFIPKVQKPLLNPF